MPSRITNREVREAADLLENLRKLEAVYTGLQDEREQLVIATTWAELAVATIPVADIDAESLAYLKAIVESAMDAVRKRLEALEVDWTTEHTFPSKVP